MPLKNLATLHLGNKFGRQTSSRDNNDVVVGFTFYEGVAPVLNAIGKHLKKLVLEDFHQVDILVIGQLCPVLEHLALSGIASFAPVLNRNQSFSSVNNTEKYKPFRYIKVLELWQAFTNSISESMLTSLLCNDAPLLRIVFSRYEPISTNTISVFQSLIYYIVNRYEL